MVIHCQNLLLSDALTIITHLLYQALPAVLLLMKIKSKEHALLKPGE